MRSKLTIKFFFAETNTNILGTVYCRSIQYDKTAQMNPWPSGVEVLSLGSKGSEFESPVRLTFGDENCFDHCQFCRLLCRCFAKKPGPSLITIYKIEEAILRTYP